MIWSAGSRVFLYRGATDMRRSFDRLAAMVEQHLAEDPLSGALFVFVNRRRDRLKILVFEGDGYALYYKRLEAGTYRIPEAPGDRAILKRADLSMLLEGIVPLKLDRRYQRPEPLAEKNPEIL